MIEGQNTFDEICNLCILVMEHMSHELGVSYGFINFMLFCVLEPLAIFFFASAAICATVLKDRYPYVTWTLFGMGVVCTLAVILPIAHAILTIPWL